MLKNIWKMEKSMLKNMLKINPKEEFQQIIDFIPSQSLTFVILIQFMQYSVQHKISIS